jgi:hypothetical protein
VNPGLNPSRHLEKQRDRSGSLDRFERPPARMPANELKMRQAAGKRIGPLVSAMFSAFSDFWRRVEAHDPSVRGLRKIVLRLRNHLDIFAPAFGAASKLFVHLRNLLDWGYEAIGRFKDLFDAQQTVVAARDPASGALVRVHASQASYEELSSGTLTLARFDRHGNLEAVAPEELEYPHRLLKESRAEVLNWIAQIEDAVRDGAFKKLQRAALKRGAPLPKSRQSRFFWAGIEAEPKLEQSALANVRVLSRGLLRKARRELTEVARLSSIVPPEQEETFHDLRKQLRAIWSILSEFPDIGPDAGRTKLLSGRLFHTVSLMGDLETMVVGQRLAFRLGDRPRSRKLARQADERWLKFRNGELLSVARLLTSFSAELERT